MELSDKAEILRRSEEEEEARALFREAHQLEAEAAKKTHVEPSRGVLFRSAAWLALEAGDAREAECCAASGLASMELPDGAAIELRAVMEEARLRLHRPDLPAPGQTTTIEFKLTGKTTEGKQNELKARRIRTAQVVEKATLHRLFLSESNGKICSPPRFRANLTSEDIVSLTDVLDTALAEQWVYGRDTPDEADL
jgi:hypothetical protein